MREISRRLDELEKRQPRAFRRVVIVSEHDPEPADADFVIRVCAAKFPGKQHA